MPVARKLENLCVQKRFDSALKLIDSALLTIERGN